MVDLDALYRTHAPRLIARLARVCGRADRAEAAVHDAFVAAATRFTTDPPARPAAWLYTVARNRLTDAARRANRPLPPADDTPQPPPDAHFDGEWDDELARMIITACHPDLTMDEQVAFALRTLCGLPRGSIARLFRAQEQTVKKRLTRARQKLQRADSLDAPLPRLAADRLPAALRVLYLVFTEGHRPRTGDDELRVDLCVEAIRLTKVLSRQFDRPEIDALLALMTLTLARVPARLTARPLLEEQDRALWDSALIREGLEHLRASARGVGQSTYHLEAGIAACHCLAPSFAATDWSRIVTFYDRLIAARPSAIYAINRAIALSFAQTPAAGLAALDALDATEVAGYLPYHAALGALAERAGDAGLAQGAYAQALALAGNAADRAYFSARLR